MDEIVAVETLVASTGADDETLGVVELGLGYTSRDLFGVLED